MKKRIKNNRKKGLAGTTAILISAGLSALTNLITSGISAANQRRIAEENNRNQTLAANFQNSITAQTNEQQALNYNRDNELETIKTGTLNTINSNFKCGGKRRMKKAGGTISANVKGLSRYI